MDKTLMTHIVAGYPNIAESLNVARTMADFGVGFLEIQIPFSDPIADGPVIMEANQKALKAGVRVEDSFRLMENLREAASYQKNEKILQVLKELTGVTKLGHETKLLFMTYYNMVYKYGLENFCRRARECGCYGLIIPDIPVSEEKYDGFIKTCHKYGLNPIQIVSPLTPIERLKEIGKVASGFVYCVSRFGTTGGGQISEDFDQYLDRVKKYINLPLAVGFGISKREQVAKVWANTDIAVVGSWIIQLV